MLGRKGAKALATFTLALGLSLGVIPLQAASACKGLESGPCQSNEKCSWVKPYTRKDGVKVNGHCKSKPNRSGDKKRSEG